MNEQFTYQLSLWKEKVEDLDSVVQPFKDYKEEYAYCIKRKDGKFAVFTEGLEVIKDA